MWTKSGSLSSEQWCGIKAKSVCRNPITTKIQRCVVRTSRSILVQDLALGLLFTRLQFQLRTVGGRGVPVWWGPSWNISGARAEGRVEGRGPGSGGSHMTCDCQMASWVMVTWGASSLWTDWLMDRKTLPSHNLVSGRYKWRSEERGTFFKC